MAHGFATQPLAWLAWQTDAVVELFSGTRAHSAAEGKLDQTMRAGMRPYVLKCEND